MSIAASHADLLRALELDRLRDERDCLRAAVEHYARPITAGNGERSVFIDVSGPARAALRDAALIRGERTS